MNSRASLIEAYAHNGRVGVLIELEVDNEFTAQTPEVKQLARDVAVQIAALNPKTQSALLHSEYVKDPSVSVGEHIHTIGKLVGERITIKQFVRWDNDPPGFPPLPPDEPEDPALARRA